MIYADVFAKLNIDDGMHARTHARMEGPGMVVGMCTAHLSSRIVRATSNCIVSNTGLT